MTGIALMSGTLRRRPFELHVDLPQTLSFVAEPDDLLLFALQIPAKPPYLVLLPSALAL